MNGESENTPRCLVTIDVPAHLILFDLVVCHITPFVTYLHMYSFDFTELHYSTFMCASNALDNIGLYGSTHQLSTSTVFWRRFIVVVRPPSSGLRPSVAIMFGLRFTNHFAWVVFGALAIFHARRIRI